MTLLVVGIGIPEVRDSELGDALRGKESEILSFFISFFVIGFYWLGHHQFFGLPASINTRLMRINLAFLDTQTALLSWILIWPLEVIVHKRLRPEYADDYL